MKTTSGVVVKRHDVFLNLYYYLLGLLRYDCKSDLLTI